MNDKNLRIGVSSGRKKCEWWGLFLNLITTPIQELCKAEDKLTPIFCLPNSSRTLFFSFTLLLVSGTA